MSRKADNKKTYTYKGRLVTAFVVILFVIALEAVYFGYHMLDNRNNVISAYKDDQAQEASVLAGALATAFDENSHGSVSGKSEDAEDAMVSKLESAVIVSGTRWAFLTKGDSIVFIKDENTTAELSKMTAAELSEYLDAQDGVVNEAVIEGTDYKVGLFADRADVLSSYGVNDFEFYIFIAVIAVLMILGGMTIEAAGRVQHMGRKVLRLENELSVRNEKFDEYEKLTDRYEDERRQKESEYTGVRTGRYYDMEVVKSLLSKSKDTGLYPITFMFISIQMGDRYFSRDEIFRTMDFIKSCMGKTHVTAEVSKGRFVVIMYKTDMAEASNIRTKLLARWNGEQKNVELDVRLRYVQADETPVVVFDNELDSIGGVV